MSGIYGASDDSESIATIHRALDAGITLIDTADFYGSGHNELLLERALSGRRRENAVISVKFGALRDPAGVTIGNDARPAAVKNSLAYTLRRLGTDYVDIYRPARLDRSVPIEETIGAIAEMVQAGYVRFIGLSEVGVETIRRAHAVHPIADLQIEYSLMSRGVEAAILPTLRELEIGMTAYGVLTGGLLSGRVPPVGNPGDIRMQRMPRFAAENVERNLRLVKALAAFAAVRGTTTALLAIAWVSGQGPDVVPLVGARNRMQLADSLASLDLMFSEEELQQIAGCVPAEAVAGARYAAPQLSALDSEMGA